MSCEPAPPASRPNRVVIHQISRKLELQWDDGQAISLGHALLRAACKCAWCEGSRRRSPDVPLAPDPGVQLNAATPIGDMGLQLHFSDGHDRGIYPWTYLQSLATQSEEDQDHVKHLL